MSNKSPRDSEDARIALEWPTRQLRQQAIVARWEIVLDLADLLIDDMEIVEQPFRGRRDRLMRRIRCDDCVISFGEDTGVVVEAPVQPAPPPRFGRDLLRRRQNSPRVARDVRR